MSTTGRRAEVLAALRRARSGLGTAEVAERVGVHQNTVRFHLDRLLEDGLVEKVATAPQGPGRPAAVFRAVARMDPTGPRDFKVLAEILTEGLALSERPSTLARDFGRTWGHKHAIGGRARPRGRAGVRQLVDLLETLGFAPERDRLEDDGHRTIGLRHCPFLEAAHAHAEVICPVHLGLMQGATQAWGTSYDVEGLDPFVTPDRCVVHLRERVESR